LMTTPLSPIVSEEARRLAMALEAASWNEALTGYQNADDPLILEKRDDLLRYIAELEAKADELDARDLARFTR
jgi:hypothetical protein